MIGKKIARYPIAYRQILLALSEEGHAFEVKYGSESEAQRERLQYYNFLKFLYRNPLESAQFNKREHNVSIRLQGKSLFFSLRTSKAGREIADALAAVGHNPFAANAENVKRALEAPITLASDAQLMEPGSFEGFNPLPESIMQPTDAVRRYMSGKHVPLQTRDEALKQQAREIEEDKDHG